MREFKFRAWCKNHKVMVYHIGSISWDGKNELFVNQDYKCAGQEVLMQYTDLKDKNGKEICEGDIVRLWGDGFPGKEYKAIVSFECAGFMITSIDNKETDYIGSVDEDQELEVIGNKYENPELLEG